MFVSSFRLSSNICVCYLTSCRIMWFSLIISFINSSLAFLKRFSSFSSFILLVVLFMFSCRYSINCLSIGLNTIETLSVVSQLIFFFFWKRNRQIGQSISPTSICEFIICKNKNNQSYTFFETNTILFKHNFNVLKNK